MAKMGPKQVTDEHKAAMSRGRIEVNAVRAYLKLLGEGGPQRGRPFHDSKKLAEKLAAATDPIERLRLRPLLRAALEAESEDPRDAQTVADFIKIAAAYSERLGITYGDWREEGVPPAVLKEAGIKR